MICHRFARILNTYGGRIEFWPYVTLIDSPVKIEELPLIDDMDIDYRVALVWDVPLARMQHRLQEVFDKHYEKFEEWYFRSDQAEDSFLTPLAAVSPI